MRYLETVRAVFIERPNRFIARVMLDGAEEIVHVKNTGRCRELLIPGRRVILSRSQNPARKTKYDLIAVETPLLGLVNLDSQIVNDAAEEWLREKLSGADIRREVKHGASRFDFCIGSAERVTFLEVKGVTLAADGMALFPDAPTERGVKHLRELAGCVRDGLGAAVLFVIQMKGVSGFRPNDATHAAFGDALREASAAGVRVMAMDCIVGEDTIALDREIPVYL